VTPSPGICLIKVMTSPCTDCVPRRLSEKIRSRWHYLKCNAMRRSKCNQCELNSPTGTSTKLSVEAGREKPGKSRGKAGQNPRKVGGAWNQSHNLNLNPNASLNPNPNPAQVRSGIGVSVQQFGRKYFIQTPSVQKKIERKNINIYVKSGKTETKPTAG